MRILSRRIICSTVAMISLVLFFTGCAQRMQNLKEETLTNAGDLAALQEIKVSEDGAQVMISSSKPLTYTFYKTASPLKVILDLSQTEPGAVTAPIEPAAGNVKRIEVSRQGAGQNVLSRVEIALAHDSEFTVAVDPNNSGKLVVNFAKSPSEQTGPKAAAGIEDTQVKAGNPSPSAPAETGNGEKLVRNGETEPKAGGKQSKTEEQEVKAEEKQAGPATKDEPYSRSSQLVKTITAVKVVNDGVEVTVQGGVDTFNSFKLTKPARLVLDIPGVKNGLAAKNIEIKNFGVDKARVGIFPDKVRIVFDMTRPALPQYRIEKTDNGLKLLLQGVASTLPVKADREAAAAPVTPKDLGGGAAPHKTSMVEAIDFKSEGGYSQIVVKVNGACIAEKPQKSANRWGITIKNCQLPPRLQRMLDTSAFPSAVQEITPYQVKIRGGYETKLLVKTRSDIPFNFRQEGDTVYWSFKNPEPEENPIAAPEPARKQPAPESVAARKVKSPVLSEKESIGEKPALASLSADRKKVYTGRKVTLEFSDADVRKIFQLIAEVSNLNFLIADDVSGTISLKLVNVPWDQALDVILDSKNLEMKRDGNIVQIKPRGRFKTLEQEESEAKREREKRMELKTRVFEINFADVKDIESKFKELGSKFPGTSVISDSRTNRVIVIDNEIRIKKMEDLLSKLDTPEKQVLIEARIVEATSTFTRDLGVQWGIHYKDASASIMGINQLDTGFGGILTQTPPTTGFQTFNDPGGSMGLSFGKLTSNIQVDMRLSAAATAGLVKVISTPKVVTLNNKAATIQQGQNIPYQTTSAEGTQTQFVAATLSLQVTPHISADGSIGMKITASNNSAAAAPAGIAPAINMKTATTELQVMNGETTVIGGIYVDSDSETDSGVPYLMDIPLLGWMFKSNSKSKTKTELLIFITPRVVS